MLLDEVGYLWGVRQVVDDRFGRYVGAEACHQVAVGLLQVRQREDFC